MILSKKVKFITDNKAEIKLKGSKEMVIYKGTSYKELGFEANDECDGNLTDKVKIEGKVDKDKPVSVDEKYTLKEIMAPDGYKLASDTIFTIDEDGEVTILDMIAVNKYRLEKSTML